MGLGQRPWPEQAHLAMQWAPWHAAGHLVCKTMHHRLGKQAHAASVAKPLNKLLDIVQYACVCVRLHGFIVDGAVLPPLVKPCRRLDRSRSQHHMA